MRLSWLEVITRKTSVSIMFLLLLMVITTTDIWHVSAQSEGGSGSIQCTTAQPNYIPSCKDDEKMNLFLFNVSENHCVEFSSCPGDNQPGFSTRKECEDACPATECPIPSAVDKGIFYMTRAEEGTVTAHYACLNSYELVGSVERRCLYDGSWSGIQPYCKQTGVVCKTPPDVEGAIKHYSCTSPGCVAVYPCKEKAGYKRVYGKGYIKCGEDGTWINDVPTCARLRVMQDESEVNDEIQVTQGQQNVEVRCIVEPSVPQSAVVQWKRVSSSSAVNVNTHWLSDNKSLALSFPMVNYHDAGKYKCIMELETQLERSVEFVVISPEPTVNRLLKHSLITKAIIILTCAFQANVKPDVQWFLDGTRLTSGNKYIISDKTKSHPQINFNVLEILGYDSSAILGSYYCEANGDNTTREWFDLQQINLLQTGRKRRSDPGKAVAVSTHDNICSDEATAIVVGRMIERGDGFSLRIQRHLKLNRSSRTIFRGKEKRLIHIVPKDDGSLPPLSLVKNDSYIFIVQVQSRNEASIVSYYPYSKPMEEVMSRACSSTTHSTDTTQLI